MSSEKREKEGSFEDMVSFLETIVHSLMPEADGSYDIYATVEEDSSSLTVNFKFSEDSFVGLLIGRKMRNILMLRTWLISQQIFIVGRAKDINIVIHKADGEVKTFGRLKKVA